MTTTTAAYHKRWRLDREAGRTRTVDSTPTREHLHELVAIAGLSQGAVADVAGVSRSTICSLMTEQQRTVRRDIADAILAVTPTKVLTRTNRDGFVLAVGARRRIRALLALGWRHEDITAAADLSTGRVQTILHQPGEWITRSAHDAIAAVYEELSMTVGPSSKTRMRAERAGYAPPLAWDDNTIDDPAGEPAPGWEPTVTPGPVDLDELLHLIQSGEDAARAVARVGADARALSQRAYRHGRADIVRALASVTNTARKANHDERTAR